LIDNEENLPADFTDEDNANTQLEQESNDVNNEEEKTNVK
jgi:hypothetical protein